MHLVRQIYNKAPLPPLGSAAGAAAGAEAGGKSGGGSGGLGKEDEGAEKEVLETAAEWQGTDRTIGHGLWFWLSTALSPPEPVGREARHLPGYKTEAKAIRLEGHGPVCHKSPPRN